MITFTDYEWFTFIELLVQDLRTINEMNIDDIYDYIENVLVRKYRDMVEE